MRKAFFIIACITLGIVAANRYIDSNNLVQGPGYRPAAMAQQLDHDTDQIRVIQAAPTKVSE
ncbi:MAG: hypothetical protein H0V66_14420 [Bdellovibrionales bacterium]|nr:hypothetical protein [Bdellovibrionales bacterium]